MSTTDVEMKVADRPTEELEDSPGGDRSRDWLDREGARTIEDLAFDDLTDLERSDWPRKAGAGMKAFIGNCTSQDGPTDERLT